MKNTPEEKPIDVTYDVQRLNKIGIYIEQIQAIYGDKLIVTENTANTYYRKTQYQLRYHYTEAHRKGHVDAQLKGEAIMRKIYLGLWTLYGQHLKPGETVLVRKKQWFQTIHGRGLNNTSPNPGEKPPALAVGR